jgi:hypothetical protein
VAVDTSKVVLKLAHPMRPEQAAMVGAEEKDYGPGDEITVGANAAMTVINAGLAQVDPGDGKAVAAALANHPSDGGNAASSGTTPASTTPPAPRTPPASS